MALRNISVLFGSPGCVSSDQIETFQFAAFFSCLLECMQETGLMLLSLWVCAQYPIGFVHISIRQEMSWQR